MQSIQIVAATSISDGVIAWLTSFFGDLDTLIKAGATVFAAGVFVFKVIESRFATTTILVAGIMAGLFVWVVWNITIIKDGVDKDINGKTTASAMVQMYAPRSDLSLSGPLR